MKIQSRRWAALQGLTLLFATTSRLAADGNLAASPSTAKLDRFEGTVREVNAADRTIAVKNFWTTRTFALGDACRVTLEDSPNGVLRELKPGQRVKIQFANHNGVRIAREINQEDLTFTGSIAALDSTNKTFRVKSGLTDRHFTAAQDCQVIFRDGKHHTFADLKIGHRVTVKYLTPGEVHLPVTSSRRASSTPAGLTPSTREPTPSRRAA
jgi:hypothetical protein